MLTHRTSKFVIQTTYDSLIVLGAFNFKISYTVSVLRNAAIH